MARRLEREEYEDHSSHLAREASQKETQFETAEKKEERREKRRRSRFSKIGPPAIGRWFDSSPRRVLPLSRKELDQQVRDCLGKQGIGDPGDIRVKYLIAAPAQSSRAIFAEGDMPGWPILWIAPSSCLVEPKVRLECLALDKVNLRVETSFGTEIFYQKGCQLKGCRLKIPGVRKEIIIGPLPLAAEEGGVNFGFLAFFLPERQGKGLQQRLQPLGAVIQYPLANRSPNL